MYQKYLHILKYLNTVEYLLTLFFLTLFLGIVIIPEAEMDLKIYANQTEDFKSALYYSPSIIYDNLEKIGKIGRKTLLLKNLSIDLIFPFFYSFLLSLLIFKIQDNLNFKNNWKVLLLPSFPFLFTILEIGIWVFLTIQFPMEYPFFARLISFFVILKCLFLSAIMIGVTLFCLMILKKWLMKEFHRH